jgi:3-mercaptopyruvate sulfurtransferase SseA
VQFKNCHKLLSPNKLKELIDDSNFQTNKNVVIVFVGFGDQHQYSKGFIPGSIYLDTNLIEKGPLWNVVSNEQLEIVINQLGISKGTTVIVYGEQIMAATRAAWALMYAGIEDVRLLDGGIDEWKALGYRVEENPSIVQEKEWSLKFLEPHSKYLSTRSDVEKSLCSNDSIVVDVRSWDEYISKTSGYDYMKEKGRIPNAVWGYAGSDPYHMEDYEENGVLKNLEQIEKLWRESGITPDKKVIFYCGTGWRASEAFFIAHLLGWQNISVYDGGWMEWSQLK